MTPSKMFSILVFCFIFLEGPFLFGQNNKSKTANKKVFRLCCYCGRIYPQKEEFCKKEKFPLVLASLKEHREILKRLAKLKPFHKRKFRRIFTRFEGDSSLQKQDVERAFYFSCLEKYSLWIAPKNPDLARAYLYAIIKFEKEKGPFAKRGMVKILEVMWLAAQMYPQKREKYLFRLTHPLLFSKKEVQNHEIMKKGEQALAWIYFQQGLKLLKEGLEKKDFAKRFLAQKAWEKVELAISNPKDPFYKFVQTCLLYFELEAFYNMGHKTLAYETAEEIWICLHTEKPKGFALEKLPFWNWLKKVIKEGKSGTNPRNPK